MSHFPFIFASYSVAAVLLAWCAAAPLLRKRRLIRDLRLTNRHGQAGNGGSHASDT